MAADEDVIKRLLAEVCAIDPATIRADRALLEYGLDSARAMDLLVGLENEFDLRIPDEDAAKLRTLADVVKYVGVRKGAT